MLMYIDSESKVFDLVRKKLVDLTDKDRLKLNLSGVKILNKSFRVNCIVSVFQGYDIKSSVDSASLYMGDNDFYIRRSVLLNSTLSEPTSVKLHLGSTRSSGSRLAIKKELDAYELDFVNWLELDESLIVYRNSEKNIGVYFDNYFYMPEMYEDRFRYKFKLNFNKSMGYEHNGAFIYANTDEYLRFVGLSYEYF